jgi:hypothetical protein
MQRLEEVRGRTLWIEARLEGLRGDEQRWFDGSLEAWRPLTRVPAVNWKEMGSVLAAVGLAAPTPTPEGTESLSSGLLRAIPYLYVQGPSSTLSDVLANTRGATRWRVKLGLKHLLAFPAVGFHPTAERNGHPAGYTMVRTTIGVLKNIVVTVRLPDVVSAEAGGPAEHFESKTGPLIIPRRFFPLRASPDGTEVARAIGIHQATTARAVVDTIRERLGRTETLADSLSQLAEGPEEARAAATYRKGVDRVREEMAQLSEVAHGLDRHIARILRRFGEPEAVLRKPLNPMVPREVELRYQFALDAVRQLRDDCRIAGDTLSRAISTYDERRRGRFELIAALLASVVLVPTLIASIFGVNLGVPGDPNNEAKNNDAFYAFVATIGLLTVSGGVAMAVAQRRDWRLRPPEAVVFVIVVVVIAVGLGAFLRWGV